MSASTLCTPPPGRLNSTMADVDVPGNLDKGKFKGKLTNMSLWGFPRRFNGEKNESGVQTCGGFQLREWLLPF